LLLNFNYQEASVYIRLSAFKKYQMKLNLKKPVLLLGLLTGSILPTVTAQGFLHAEGQRIVKKATTYSFAG